MFQIQIGYPNIDQSDAIFFGSETNIFFSLFRNDRQSFFIIWKKIPIRFRYREDLQINFSSIVQSINNLSKKREGTDLLSLSNESLELKIKMQWKDEFLILNLEAATNERLHNLYKDALNKNHWILIRKSEFLSEWHTLLHQILLSLDAGGFFDQNKREEDDLIILQSLADQIDGFGYMYR